MAGAEVFDFDPCAKCRANDARKPCAKCKVTAYRARWRDPQGKSQGKVFRVGRVPEAKKTAERYAVQQEAAVTDGTYVSGGKVKLKDFAAEWVAAQGFDESTRVSVDSRLRNHLYDSALGAMSLNAIKALHVQAWVKGLSCGPSTAAVILGHVSAIFGAAVDSDMLSKNPAKARSVRPPSKPEKKAQPWAPETALKIIDALPDRYRALGACAFGLGLRQGELFGLHPSDIDWLGRWVRVDRQVKIVGGTMTLDLPKGRKTRKVPLPEWVGFELSEHIRRQGIDKGSRVPPMGPLSGPVPLLFTSSKGTALVRNSWNVNVWKPALTATGEDDQARENGIHRARHTFASILLAEGESIAAVSEWLGHSSSTITLGTYAHVMPKAEDRGRRILDAAFRPERGTDASKEAQ